jgi:outer membrane protein
MPHAHRGIRLLGLVVLTTIALAAPAYAQEQGEWRYGFRLINIGADATTERILDSDSRIEVDSAIFAEFDMTYMLGQTWGMEWMITAAPHDVSVQSGIFDGLDMGSVWIGETTLTFQYVFSLYGPWRPYLGAGLALASVITSDTSDGAETIGIDKLSTDLGIGPVGQIGVAYRLNKRWILSLDVKWMSVPMDVELKGDGGTIDTVELDWQPLIIGLGGAARF